MKQLSRNITYKSREEINFLIELGREMTNYFDMLYKHIKPGIKLFHIEKLSELFLKKYSLKSVMLGFKGFPSVVSTSVNEILAHGIPDDTILREGDVLKVDIVLERDGLMIDSAHTYGIGRCDFKTNYLIKNAFFITNEVISNIQVNNNISTIGNYIYFLSRKKRLNIFYQFNGHGVGYDVHEGPKIINYKNYSDILIENGMVFTVEPIFTLGKIDSICLSDGSYMACDGEKTSQFEYSIAIMDNKSIILR